MAASAYTLLQSYGIDFAEYRGGVPDWRGKLTGTLGGPNFMAGYLAMSLPAGLWMLGDSGKLARIALVAGLVIVLCALLVTWSFGAWTGLIGAAFVLLGFRKFRKCAFRKLSVLPLSLLGLVCAFYLLPNPLNGVGRSLFEEAFASNRWLTGGAARAFIWKTTALMVRDRPIRGIGFGNYFRVHQHYQGELYRLRDRY